MITKAHESEDKIAVMAYDLSLMLSQKLHAVGQSMSTTRYMASFYLSLKKASTDHHLKECFMRAKSNIEKLSLTRESKAPSANELFDGSPCDGPVDKGLLTSKQKTTQKAP